VWANVTVVDPRRAGYTTAYPCADGRPLASHNNFVRGDVVPNFGIFRTDGAGRVCLFTTSQAHLLWDHYGPAAPISAHEAQRAVDTRTANGPTAGRPVPAGGTLRVHAGRTGMVLGNLTVTEPRAAGFTTVWPCDQPRPLASVNGYAAGQTVPALAVSATDATGDVCVYTSQSAHLVWDTTAFTDQLASGAPLRGLDTRDGTGPIAPGRVVTVAGPPNGTVVATLTVTEPRAPGYTVAYPCSAGRAATSVNNFTAGATTANSVAVRADADGRVCLETSATTHLVWDEMARYSGGADSDAPMPPTRLLDTRLG
jgi:hypothetical protein